MTVLAVAQPITVEHLVAPGALARKAMARAGESVAKFLKRNRWRFDLDTILVINGKPVLRRDDGWKARRFAPGDVVRFVSRPFGGGNQGKQIGGLIALIALTVFASWAVGPTLLGSTLLAAGAKALIVAGGMLLYNTLVYPKPGNRSDEDGLFSFNAAGNTARPLEAIPLAYGRLQRDLDYAALPYKTYDGTDEYFNGLFMIGCGRYDHEAILVEDVELWRADAPARPGEPPGTGSGSTVPGFTQVWVNPTSGTRPSSPGVLDPFEDVQIEFVEPGQPVTLFPTNVHQSPEVNGLEFGSPSDAGGGWSAWFPVCNPDDVTSLIHLDIALPSGFVRNDHATEASYTVEIRPINVAGAPIGPAVSTTRLYAGLHRKPHRFTHSFPQATPARYALRFRRDAPPLSGATTDFYAAGLRAEIPGQTLFPEGTMLAVRIKATKQLSDYSSRRIRYRGTRILPVWNGSGWVEQATRNPIWAAIDFRTHPDYGGRMPLNRLQLDEWIVEAANAAARGDTFDFEFKNAVKVGEGLDTILAAARCKHRWYGHILSLVRDEWRPTPRMLITDREMVAGSFSLTANFRDANAPDGLIVNYIDEETWRPAQVTVPIGSSPVNPITEELRGVTKRDHATREAIFKWNAQTKRRIGPSFTMLLDGHLLGYGDHVEIQSRTPQAWGAPHPVVGFSGNTVRLPKAPDWGDGVTLYGAIRMKDGGLFGPCLVVQGSTPRHVVFSETGLSAVLAATGKTLADALDRAPDAAPPTLVLGEAFDFLKRMQVVSVEPRGDKAQVAGFLDVEEVHSGTAVEAPRPPAIVFPAKEMPRVVSLDARLKQTLFETRIEASWPAAPPATRYVLEVQYEEATRPIPVWSGPETSCDVVVDNYAAQARVVPYGDRGAGYPSPWVNLVPIEPRLPREIVDFDALNGVVQRAVTEAIAQAKKEAQDQLDRMQLVIQDLEEQVQSNRFTETRRVESVRDTGVSRLREAERVLTEADQAAAERLEGLEASVNNPSTGLVATRATLTTFQSTQTTFNSATSSSLASLAASLTTLDGAVSANSSAIGVLQASVITINGTLTSQATQITSLQSGLTTANSNITANATAIGTLTTRVTSAEGTITSQSGQITSLTNSLSTTNGTVAANSSAITSLQSSVSSINGTLSSYASQLTTLNAQVGSLNASVTTIAAATVGPSGTSAVWGIRLNAANRVGSLYSMNNGSVVAFAIQADIFSIARPSDGATVLGWDGFNNVLTINGATFVAGVVTSPTGRVVIDLNNATIEMWD